MESYVIMIALLVCSALLLTIAMGAVPDPLSDPQVFIKELLEAFTQKNWKFVAAFVLVALVGVTKKWIAPKLAKGKWTWVLAVAMSAILTVATALGAGKVDGFTDLVSYLLTGVFLGLGAVGTHQGLKEFGVIKSGKPAGQL